MPLSEPVTRNKIYRRNIDSQGFLREDGLWDIETSTDLAPMNACSDPNLWYKKLIGEKIATGWRNKIRDIFAGVNGCTHLNDMLGIAAATAFQTVYPWHLQQNISDEGSKEKAFRYMANMMLNSCHGFSEKGKMVSSHWPDLTSKTET